MPIDVTAFDGLQDMKYGAEPVLIVELLGVFYSTKTFRNSDGNTINGKIISISGLDTSIKHGDSGASGNVNITMDDIDQTFKNIVFDNDLQKTPVNIYLGFAVLGVVGVGVCIFKGEMITPIEVVTFPPQFIFSIAQRIDDYEIGFSLEEDTVLNISSSAIGQPWPICFGNVIRQPALKMTEQVSGVSLTRYSILSCSDINNLEKAAEQFGKVQYDSDQYNNQLPDYLTSRTMEKGTITKNIITEDVFGLFNMDFDKDKFATIMNDYHTAYVQLITIKDSLVKKCPDRREDILAFADMVSINEQNQRWYQYFALKTEEYRIKIEFTESQIIYYQSKIDLVGFIEPEEMARMALYAQMLKYYMKALPMLIQIHNELLDFTSGYQAATAWQAAEIPIKKQKLLQMILTEIYIDYGSRLPLDIEFPFTINGALMLGIFDGTKITITQNQIPTDKNVELAARVSESPSKIWIVDTTISLRGKYCFLTGPNGRRLIFITDQYGNECNFKTVLWYQTDTVEFDEEWMIVETSPYILDHWVTPKLLEDLDKVQDSGWGFDVGDIVLYGNDYSDYYIANSYPSTEVVEVYAHRTIGNVTKLVPVPESYYRVNLSYSYFGYDTTCIKLPRPLHQYQDEGWSDEIYVSLKSTLPYNTADVIKWIFENYTDIAVDSASFSEVAGYLTNYPSHFMLSERANAIEVAERIAWQARCAIVIRNNTVYIKYLSKRYDSVKEIVSNTIIIDSLKYSVSETDNLATKFVATWNMDGAREERKIILRNNIPKYGLIEKSEHFFIYNIQDLVIKSATFWLFRYSNSWKRCSFSTILSHIDLEVYDAITLNYNVPIYGIIEQITYNILEGRIDFVMWIPEKCGANLEYPFAFPKDVSVSLVYPYTDDLYTGGTGGDWSDRPADIGSEYPSDQWEALHQPGDPINNRTTTDYAVRTDKTPEVKEEPALRIDLSATKIYDPTTKLETTGDTLLSVVEQPISKSNVLAINTKFNFYDWIAKKIANFDICYDETKNKFTVCSAGGGGGFWFGKIKERTGDDHAVVTPYIPNVAAATPPNGVTMGEDVPFIWIGKDTWLDVGDDVIVFNVTLPNFKSPDTGDWTKGWAIALERALICRNFNPALIDSNFQIGCT